MHDPKTIQLLLVEDQLEDEHLIREAITEIIEAPHWPNWHTCELIPAGCLSEAIDLLERCRFDAILLNLSLPDGDRLLDTFTRVRQAAGGVPIVVLADEEDESLAHTLLREGAQDVLLKSDLECAPLARALRYGMERQRRTRALESISFFDELTGLYNDRAFGALVEHDLQLADRHADRLLVAQMELTGLPVGREARDLVLLHAAELLRTAFPDASVVARIANDQFGVCTPAVSPATIESAAERLERDLAKHGPVRVRTACRVGPETAMLASQH